METAQYVTKQPMDHWRNQRGNKKLPTGKTNKHSDPKSIGPGKIVLRGKILVINIYMKKKERSEVNN